MTIVVDASVVVSALVDSGDDGTRAEMILRSNTLAAPHLLPAEVSNVLRRSARTGLISADVAALAVADFDGLDIELFAFAPFSGRIWELRHDVSSYDAWYVALAETLEAPLATLDRRLARSAGPRCRFLTD